MKKIALIMLLLLCAQGLFAQEEDESGITTSSSLNLQISTLPEAKLSFIQQFKFPFLQGSNPLTEGNNINLMLRGEISPVSMNGILGVVWTPIAFFEFNMGGRVGSGWYLEALNAKGIGINYADGAGKAKLDSSPFDGLLWGAWTGGTIQMDFAALFPGDWNHVVFQTYHEINYKGYSRAKNFDSWYYEADAGENCNGFNYYGNFVLGYQMPLSPVLNMIALLTEMDLYLYDTPNRSSWGDERIRWTFSAIYNFIITKQFSFAVITQLRTMRNYKELDWEELYYRNRSIDKNKPLRLEPYRIAVSFTYKF